MQCISIQGNKIHQLPTCSPGDLVILTVQEATGQDLAILGVTPEAIASVFGWGFAAILLMWSFGFAVGSAINVIRRI